MALNLAQTDILEWWYADRTENKPVGPISLRDLEVLWETHAIDSQTLVWKQSMPEWRKIDDIEDLKKKILEDTSISFNQPVLQPPVNMAPSNGLDNVPQTVSNITSQANDPEDDLASLEKKFEKIKKKFHQGEDGLWYVLDPVTNQLTAQKDAPSIDIDDDILEGLIKGIAGDEGDEDKKNRKRRGPKAPAVDLDTLTDEQIKKIERNRKKAKKQAEKKKEKWYSAKINASVYAKGLPDDVTDEELRQFFSKAGVIRLDLKTGTEKIKLYKDDKGRLKGDALVSYLRGESVDLALDMLNEAEIRTGYKVHLERAQFEQKGDYVPRKKVKEDKVSSIKIKTDQDRMLTWDEEDHGEGLKIVVITNMFTLEEADAEPDFVENLRQDILEECEAKLGPVARITVFEDNPIGAVQIKFRDDASAEACIKLMNNRYFGGRQLSCFYWDGKTDYKRTRTTIEDEQKRLEDFGKWLEQGEEKSDKAQNKQDHTSSDEEKK